MEIEFFTPPAEAGEWFEHWVEACWNWFIDLGIDPENMRRFDVPEEDRAHYSAGTIDVEYQLRLPRQGVGRAHGRRQPHRLRPRAATPRPRARASTYFDQASGEKYTPYVIEPSFGLTRAMMAFLVDAYREEEVPNAKGGTDTRTVLKLDPRLAPVKVAVLPLSRNEQLSPHRARGRRRPARPAGTSTSTTPAPSAAATAARTRSARRSASRSTSTRSTTAPSPCATATRWPGARAARRPAGVPRRAPQGRVASPPPEEIPASEGEFSESVLSSRDRLSSTDAAGSPSARSALGREPLVHDDAAGCLRPPPRGSRRRSRPPAATECRRRSTRTCPRAV